MNNLLDNNPLVTIGIPNYNYSCYVIEAIESAVNQTYPNIEVIIVDDSSTDNSVEVIENWLNRYEGNRQIKLIKNETNLGLSGSCNVILKNASGKYYQTLDADDLILPDKISRQIQIIDSTENTCLIYSNTFLIDENGKSMNEDYLKRINYDAQNMPGGNIFEELFKFNFIPLPSVLINKKMAIEVGGYDNNLQVQDYNLWLKLTERFPVVYMSEATAFYRVHTNSMSSHPRSNIKSIDSVLKIKYRYYNQVNSRIQKIIRKNIHFSIPDFYAQRFPEAKIWMKRDLSLNPGLKSFAYYSAYHLGIPYQFFISLKKIKAGFRKNGK